VAVWQRTCASGAAKGQSLSPFPCAEPRRYPPVVASSLPPPLEASAAPQRERSAESGALAGAEPRGDDALHFTNHALNRGFWQLLDAVPGAWFFTRPNGTFAYVNRGACMALGYSREELLAATVFDIDPAVTREQWALLWTTAASPDSRVVRTTHRRRNGSVFPVEVRALRLYLDGEELAASYAVDLTASEQTRVALIATEARLQRLLDHLPDLVFRMRLWPRLVLEFVSPSSTALLGYTPEELVLDERSTERIIHRVDLGEFLSLHQTPPGTGRKIRFVNRQGRVVWMELRATLLQQREGHPLVIEGVARDVTKSHEAEVAHRHLLAAIEQAAEAVVVTDKFGRIEYVNPAYAATSGVTEAEAIGEAWQRLEVREDPAFIGHLAEVMVAGEVWKGRIKSVRTDGRRYDESATVSPLRDERGAQVGCVAVKRDITEQLLLERQLQRSQKMEAVGQLAGGIAHDFNNLLHIILGNSQLLRLKMRGSALDDPQLEQVLSEVITASQRAADLVRQLLAFSRKGGVDFSELRLDQVVGNLSVMLQRLLGGKVDLIWQCNTGPAYVNGNAAQLEQLVTNLCINARDAMSHGGRVRVTLDEADAAELPPQTRTGEPEGGTVSDGDVEYLKLTVQDEGEGMTLEVQRRLFEPFFTTKQPGKGTGLGLATVYAVVQGHGGLIDFHSSLGVGTTFRVYLPRSKPPSRAGAARGQSSPVDGQHRLVLVAEDERGVALLTANYLEHAGFRVITAADGHEAERLIQEHGDELCLAVLDAVMPGPDGLDLYQALRRGGLSTPVVFVSGYDYESLGFAQDQHGVAVLKKPFSSDELLVLVARVLDGGASP
jgi:two-component system cell cycle sensor histidine kinase/response regulator CckA